MTPHQEHVQGVGAEEVRMQYLVVASGVALAIGFRVICLILEFRDTFSRPKEVEPNPIRLHEPPPGGRQGRHTRSSRP